MRKYFHASILISILATVLGCQTMANKASYAEKKSEKNWKAAYEVLEALVDKNPNEETIDYAKEEINKNPSLLAYGQYLFSKENLTFWQSRAGDFSVPRKRLDIYCAIAPTDSCKNAISNISEAESSLKPRIYALDKHYESLDLVQKESIGRLYDIKIIRSENVGRIVDRQSEDNSTTANSAGSALGEAVASAIYIDKSITASSFNYSAKGHLAAQLAGAVLGSSLNKESVRIYRMRYTIKKLNGDTIYYDENSGSAIGHSIGVCFDIERKVTINESFCKSDSSEYLIGLINKK